MTADQFADLIEQENASAVHSRYGRVVQVGEADGIPLLTFTSPHLDGWATPSCPTLPYLRLIAAGLAEAHGLGPAAAARYLVAAPGASGRFDPGELAEALA